MKRILAAGISIFLITSHADAGIVLGYNLSTGLPNNELGSFTTSFAPSTDLAAINGQLWGFSNEPIPPVPIPAALPLLMSALGVFGFLGWRRKRVAS